MLLVLATSAAVVCRMVLLRTVLLLLLDVRLADVAMMLVWQVWLVDVAVSIYCWAAFGNGMIFLVGLHPARGDSNG